MSTAVTAAPGWHRRWLRSLGVISVDARGRMGNAMFQLAFAHAASRRLGTSFVFGDAHLEEDFALGAWGRPQTRLARKLAFRARYGREGPKRVFVRDEEDPAEVLASLRDGVAYGGFFQSERYFAGFEDAIRRLFIVRREHREAFVRRYGDLGRYLCMHVRRADYLQTGGWALPTSWFHDALATVGDRAGRQLIVISDDLPAVREELRDLEGARFEANPPLVDLQLLINADVVIASNSSFSWWGAWLNEHAGARVLAPEHWVGFSRGVESPRDVIPPRWEQVPVVDASLSAP